MQTLRQLGFVLLCALIPFAMAEDASAKTAPGVVVTLNPVTMTNIKPFSGELCAGGSLTAPVSGLLTVNAAQPVLFWWGDGRTCRGNTYVWFLLAAHAYTDASGRVRAAVWGSGSVSRSTDGGRTWTEQVAKRTSIVLDVERGKSASGTWQISSGAGSGTLKFTMKVS